MKKLKNVKSMYAFSLQKNELRAITGGEEYVNEETTEYMKRKGQMTQSDVFNHLD